MKMLDNSSGFFVCLLCRLSLPCAVNIESSGYAITAHKSGCVDQVIIPLITLKATIKPFLIFLEYA